jgi:acyl carrier protein
MLIMDKKIIEQISEIVEEDVTEKSVLSDLDMWDSLAVISFLVFTKSELGVQFENVDLINECKTVGDLCKITMERVK